MKVSNRACRGFMFSPLVIILGFMIHQPMGCIQSVIGSIWLGLCIGDVIYDNRKKK